MSHKLVSLYIGDGEYYTRTDADNVIAELKESVKGLILDNYLKDKELRRHKYKRCLAMAKWCESVLSVYPWYGEISHEERRWLKWQQRWLELAEKFKPNKEAK